MNSFKREISSVHTKMNSDFRHPSKLEWADALEVGAQLVRKCGRLLLQKHVSLPRRNSSLARLHLHLHLLLRSLCTFAAASVSLHPRLTDEHRHCTRSTTLPTSSHSWVQSRVQSRPEQRRRAERGIGGWQRPTRPWSRSPPPPRGSRKSWRTSRWIHRPIAPPGPRVTISTNGCPPSWDRLVGLRSSLHFYYFHEFVHFFRCCDVDTTCGYFRTRLLLIRGHHGVR